MGRYDKVGTARATRDSNYIRPFHGLAVIERTSQGETATNNAPFDAIEMLAVHDFGDLPANNVQPSNLPVPSRHRIGEAFTDMILVNSVSHAGNVAGFIMGAMGTDQNPTAKDCEHVFGSDKNPLGGKVVEIKAWNVIKKKNKGDYERDPDNAKAEWLFTKVAYVRPVELSEVAQIVAEAGTLEQVLPHLPELAEHVKA